MSLQLPSIVLDEPVGSHADQAQAEQFRLDTLAAQQIAAELQRFGKVSICWQGMGEIGDETGDLVMPAYIVVVSHLTDLADQEAYAAMVEHIRLTKSIDNDIEVVIASQDSPLGKAHCGKLQ